MAASTQERDDVRRSESHGRQLVNHGWVLTGDRVELFFPDHGHRLDAGGGCTGTGKVLELGMGRTMSSTQVLWAWSTQRPAPIPKISWRVVVG
jgi:hypothetical protein